MLKGQAKKDYQREWIRRKRMRNKLKDEGRIVEPLSNPKLNSVEPVVEPDIVIDYGGTTIQLDADGEPMPDEE